MDFNKEVESTLDNPQALEALYQSAQEHKGELTFRDAIEAGFERNPNNLLLAAWHYRLQEARRELRQQPHAANWKLAIPLGILTGLLLWILSNPRLDFPTSIPFPLLIWAPLGALAVTAFLTRTNRRGKITIPVIVGLLLATIYATLWTKLQDRPDYLLLMLIHLPLLSWIAAGLHTLGMRTDHKNTFAFIFKSLEVFITGGLFLMAGGLFAGITVGLFDTLLLTIPESVMRLIGAGGIGLVSVLTVASVYDPLSPPAEQRFHQGLGRIITTIMWLLLPLTGLVLVIYLCVIPFNFMAPFTNRDVLIVYNVMLFAIMGLLIGATPVYASELSDRQQSILRISILTVAGLTVVVSLYALSATAYRTVLGGITMNRLTILGWNTINIGILISLLIKQIKRKQTWIASIQRTFSKGSLAYLFWTVFLLLAVPLLFPV
jgi:hypothetical protein